MGATISVINKAAVRESVICARKFVGPTAAATRLVQAAVAISTLNVVHFVNRSRPFAERKRPSHPHQR
jgi:hypothetical protein